MHKQLANRITVLIPALQVYAARSATGTARWMLRAITTKQMGRTNSSMPTLATQAAVKITEAA